MGPARADEHRGVAIDPSATAKDDFQAGVVRITTNEYEKGGGGLDSAYCLSAP
jgi:hypothetical protein